MAQATNIYENKIFTTVGMHTIVLVTNTNLKLIIIRRNAIYIHNNIHPQTKTVYITGYLKLHAVTLRKIHGNFGCYRKRQ